jgi:hypothetical protein
MTDMTNVLALQTLDGEMTVPSCGPGSSHISVACGSETIAGMTIG